MTNGLNSAYTRRMMNDPIRVKKNPENRARRDSLGPLENFELPSLSSIDPRVLITDSAKCQCREANRGPCRKSRIKHAEPDEVTVRA